MNVLKTRHYTSDHRGQPTANSKSLVQRQQRTDDQVSGVGNAAQEVGDDWQSVVAVCWMSRTVFIHVIRAHHPRGLFQSSNGNAVNIFLASVPKGLDTYYSATYMSRLVTSSALQSRKWQLIGMSQWCRSALCGHPLPALTDNWTHGAASTDTPSPQSATLGLHPVAVANSFPSR